MVFLVFAGIACFLKVLISSSIFGCAKREFATSPLVWDLSVLPTQEAVSAASKNRHNLTLRVELFCCLKELPRFPARNQLDPGAESGKFFETPARTASDPVTLICGS